MIIACKEKMFNRSNSFYKAKWSFWWRYDHQATIAAIVLPMNKADEAAECNLDFNYRGTKPDGQPRKPHMVGCALKSGPKAKKERIDALAKEYEILNKYKG